MRLSMLNRCNCRNEKTGTAKVNASSNVGSKILEISKTILGKDGSGLKTYRKTYCTTRMYNQTDCRLVFGSVAGSFIL